MPRYKDRLTTLFDLFDPFEATDSGKQVYNAISAIQRIRDEGQGLFPVGSEPSNRWERGCLDLTKIINRYSPTVWINADESLSFLDDFVREFAHTEERLHQLLYVDSIPEEQRKELLNVTWNWFNIVFRFAIYSILLGIEEVKGDD